MSPVLKSLGLYQAEKMWNGSCPAEKMKPLLGSQETQVKQNGTTHVTIAPKGGESTEAGPTGLLSWLKAGAPRWDVLTLVLNLIVTGLLIVITIYVVLIFYRCHLCPPTPACPDAWVGYQGKCYYFSEPEADWTSSQSNCFALRASLAGIDTQQEMDFMMRYKRPSDYWIGLRREPNQPWKWTNGTKFNNWFNISGEENCASINGGDIASSSCSSKKHWICSKQV